MKIKFCGAAQEVTGSSHLLEINGQKILLDCGLAQGMDDDRAYKLNREFLFDPSEIDVVILSHAHIDHSGRIPYLCNQGFKGKIHCTTPTIELCEIMLLDAANIQVQDADFRARHFDEAVEALYEPKDIPKVISHMVGHEYKASFDVLPGVKVTFFDAGHVFGSAQVLLEFLDDGVPRKLLFTGDLGRKYLPILNDPALIPEANILITESTYASHVHDAFQYVFDELEWIVNDVYKRGGKIIVPGFSLERTQEMVYVLHKLYLEKKIPTMPIYVDSPMSTRISEVFMKHTAYYDNESFRDFLNQKTSPFAFSQLHYTMSIIDSKKINDTTEPCIIIAGSGMCQGGRIQHHLRRYIGDPRNLILVIGYMARGTVGRSIVEKDRKVKIFNEYLDLKADVVVLNEFSAHADKLELLEHIKSIKNLKQIFVVHGEELETEVMRDNIYNILKFKGRVDIPTYGEEFLLVKDTVESHVNARQAEYLKALREREDSDYEAE